MIPSAPDTGAVDAAQSAADAARRALPLEVAVADGVLRGALENGARVFRGIPYAAPPIGPLRFAPPAPPLPWAGVRAASAFGASCIQADDGRAAATSEDCLFLNVFTPPEAASSPLPVMVFLHGGGITGGSADYPGEWLVRSEQVVLVTVSYRLGPLSGLVHPALDAALGQPSGNLGLRDQQRALTWVQGQIAAFGGDPARVMLFGESFGAMSACLHLFSGASAGLAQRFGLESGSCVGGHMAALDRAEALANGRRVVERVCPGVADAELLTCLRAAPASAYVPASQLELLDYRFYVDGVLLADAPEALLAQGRVADAPVLLGHNLREFAAFYAQGVPRPGSQLGFGLMLTAFHPEHASDLAALYAPASDAGADEAFVALQTDAMFRCPTDRLAHGLAALGRPVYRYRFDVPPAVHAFELDYVFGWPSGGVGAAYPEAPKPSLPGVVARVQRAWASFARDGVPESDALAWPRFDATTGGGLVLTEPVSALAPAAAEARCAKWRSLDVR